MFPDGGGTCTWRARRCKAKQGRHGKTALTYESYLYSSTDFAPRTRGLKDLFRNTQLEVISSRISCRASPVSEVISSRISRTRSALPGVGERPKDGAGALVRDLTKVHGDGEQEHQKEEIDAKD